MRNSRRLSCSSRPGHALFHGKPTLAILVNKACKHSPISKTSSLACDLLLIKKVLRAPLESPLNVHNERKLFMQEIARAEDLFENERIKRIPRKCTPLFKRSRNEMNKSLGLYLRFRIGKRGLSTHKDKRAI